VRVTNSDIALFCCFDANAILCYATLVCSKYFMIEFIIIISYAKIVKYAIIVFLENKKIEYFL